MTDLGLLLELGPIVLRHRLGRAVQQGARALGEGRREVTHRLLSARDSPGLRCSFG